jgi:hypothetical protein
MKEYVYCTTESAKYSGNGGRHVWSSLDDLGNEHKGLTPCPSTPYTSLRECIMIRINHEMYLRGKMREIHMTDGSDAITLALSNRFPDAFRLNCYFHFIVGRMIASCGRSHAIPR